MLIDDDLNSTDRRVLSVLDEGRVTPQYVAGQLDVSRTYASERLKRLLEHAHVSKIAPGLYELVDDPRDADQKSGRKTDEGRKSGNELADALESYVESESVTDDEYEALHEAWQVLDARSDTNPTTEDSSDE